VCACALRHSLVREQNDDDDDETRLMWAHQHESPKVSLNFNFSA
jgi:hypothetical protein